MYFQNHLVHLGSLFLIRKHWLNKKHALEKFAMKTTKLFRFKQLQTTEVNYIYDLALQIKKLVFASEPEYQVYNIVLNLLSPEQIKVLLDPKSEDPDFLALDKTDSKEEDSLDRKEFVYKLPKHYEPSRQFL